MSAAEQPAGDHTRYDAAPEGKPDATRYDSPPAAEADATRFTADRVDADATGYTPTAPPRSPANDRTGPRRFGDYELLAELGRGGMGVVYKARHLPSGRLVALKRILSGALASPQAVERFRTEAKAAAKLDHPHIVPVYDVDEVDGQLYFTMQLLTGGTLQQRLQQGPLLPAQAAALVRQLAEAVQHAHERGVVHRDIKPANVLIVESSASAPARPQSTGPEVAPPTRGEEAPAEDVASLVPAAMVPSPSLMRDFPDNMGVKLTDFGLARLTEGSGLTATGEQLGTPGYMAPEQAVGRAREVGPAADVYSLGALLYCLLVGRPPFQAATALETMRQVLERDLVPPRQLNPQVPGDLEAICLKCLEKSQHRRYDAAHTLAEDLRRFQAGEPTLARPKGFWLRAWLWSRHPHRVRDAGAFTIFLMLILTAWFVAGVVRHWLLAMQRGSFWPFNNPPIPTSRELAVLHLLGVLGGCFLPLFFTGIGTIKRKVWALWAGLVVSLVDFLVLVAVLGDFGDVLSLVDLANLYADPEVRFPLFALLAVLIGVVFCSYMIGLLAFISNRVELREVVTRAPPGNQAGK